MPYDIKKISPRMYQVSNTDTGKIHAKHSTLKNAKAQLRLLQTLEGAARCCFNSSYCNGTTHYRRPKTGGAITGTELKKLTESSYKLNKEKPKKIGDLVLDKELSTRKAAVYANPKTGEAVVTHRGTTGTASDWANNLAMGVGLYKKTDRYQKGKETQKAVNAKYGKENVITTSHSQSGQLAHELNKEGLVNKSIEVNPARLPGQKVKKNETIIKSSFDPVSVFAQTGKQKGKVDVIKAKSFNPLAQHSAKIIRGEKSKKMYGGAVFGTDADTNEIFDYFNIDVGNIDRYLYWLGLPRAVTLGRMLRNENNTFERFVRIYSILVAYDRFVTEGGQLPPPIPTLDPEAMYNTETDVTSINQLDALADIAQLPNYRFNYDGLRDIFVDLNETLPNIIPLPENLDYPGEAQDDEEDDEYEEEDAEEEDDNFIGLGKLRGGALMGSDNDNNRVLMALGVNGMNRDKIDRYLFAKGLPRLVTLARRFRNTDSTVETIQESMGFLNAAEQDPRDYPAIPRGIPDDTTLPQPPPALSVGESKRMLFQEMYAEDFTPTVAQTLVDIERLHEENGDIIPLPVNYTNRIENYADEYEDMDDEEEGGKLGGARCCFNSAYCNGTNHYRRPKTGGADAQPPPPPPPPPPPNFNAIWAAIQAEQLAERAAREAEEKQDGKTGGSLPKRYM